MYLSFSYSDVKRSRDQQNIRIRERQINKIRYKKMVLRMSLSDYFLQLQVVKLSLLYYDLSTIKFYW